jgi:hypothetical protein
MFHDKPQYRLSPQPAVGKFSCDVLQTINDKHLASGTIYLTEEEALRGGLEDLRKALGW